MHCSWKYSNPSGENRAASVVGNRYGFTGREYDSETGLYYYRARYYDPAIGRFLQEDSVWDVNLYTYVDNNPVNWVDPYGEFELLPDFMTIPDSVNIPRTGVPPGLDIPEIIKDKIKDGVCSESKKAEEGKSYNKKKDEQKKPP